MVDRKSVLVVDDDRENIMFIGEILKKDYNVRAAVRGEQALEIVKSDNPPDIIILDVVMPEMNGYELCKKIKKISEIPIIFLSGKSDIEERRYAMEIGGSDFISKPSETDRLIEAVKVRI